MINKKNIYLDMDSVTCNFTRSVAKIFKLENLPLNLPDGLYPWFGDDENIKRIRLNEVMEDCHFWAKLYPYSYARELVRLIEKYGDLYFLSRAFPNAGCFAGKMKWVQIHFPHLIDNVILVTKNKWVCSNRDSILIDDDLGHKNKWIEKGGLFFHWEEILDVKENRLTVRDRLVKLEEFLINH